MTRWLNGLCVMPGVPNLAHAHSSLEGGSPRIHVRWLQPRIQPQHFALQGFIVEGASLGAQRIHSNLHRLLERGVVFKDDMGAAVT